MAAGVDMTPTHLTLLDEAIETLGAAIDMSASLSTVDDPSMAYVARARAKLLILRSDLLTEVTLAAE